MTEYKTVPVNARDLDALRYVLNRSDEASRIRTVMSTFTLPERETTAERLERLYTALKTAAPAVQPAAGREEIALHLKLLDTLKPFADVAEKLKHCHVVEICEPTPDNPSRNIIPMPREWFERAADALEVIAIQLHADGTLSEGQAAKITGLDRVEVRKQADAILAALAHAPAQGSESGPGGWLINSADGVWEWTGVRMAGVAALTEGLPVWSVSRGAYEPTALSPQPGPASEGDGA